ncbi:hypothetical protein CH373_17940 [Leptospira perolatii]|uniref:Uncharacterized protein n=1 Tax=Leptospira perolatii TaxID=2023191 RepID=A0A2M9ZI54_9LEPT|nr:ankyrin repeat domain-containing protein [Leptospira perolatii]PJZ68129.1 hypothetical protein CH360_17885 [Leptospira perolatii]PJZ71750.1 hypothetical protein CH373_17940 [Leptospira perolatii]
MCRTVRILFLITSLFSILLCASDSEIKHEVKKSNGQNGQDKDLLSKKEMFHLVKIHNIPQLKKLVDAGASVNLQDNHGEISKPNEGETLLMVAVTSKNVPVVKFLIENGASVSASSTKNEKTALHIAAESGNIEMGKLLLDNKAWYKSKSSLVNSRMKDGTTPLLLAIKKGKSEFVHFLIEEGVDVNEKTSDGKSPLHIAKAAHQAKIVKLLTSAGGTE